MFNEDRGRHRNNLGLIRQNYLKRKQPVTRFRFLVASRIAKHFSFISSSYFISSFVVCGCYRNAPPYQSKGKKSSTVSFFYLYVHLFVSLSIQRIFKVFLRAVSIMKDSYLQVIPNHMEFEFIDSLHSLSYTSDLRQIHAD